MSASRPLWREPLVHFVALALVILAAERVLAPAPGPAPIVLDDAFAAGLVEEATRRGEPAAGDPVARWLDEEVLLREALALGLDRGDPIVRRRLVQKMEFLLRSELALAEPDDAALQALLEARPERFRQPARVAFRHVFFDRERREDPRADAEVGLERVREAEILAIGIPPELCCWCPLRGYFASGEDLSDIGDPFLLGKSFALAPLERHAAQFGAWSAVLSWWDAWRGVTPEQWDGRRPSAWWAALWARGLTLGVVGL
ncbi:MAG: hypothetical protein AAGH15_10770, partial [Myxococcota bacterium]